MDLADTANGLMAIPNLVAVIMLSGTVVKLDKRILRTRRREGLKVYKV